MSIYKIPLKFKTGEFKFSERNIGTEDEKSDARRTYRRVRRQRRL